MIRSHVSEHRARRLASENRSTSPRLQTPFNVASSPRAGLCRLGAKRRYTSPQLRTSVYVASSPNAGLRRLVFERRSKSPHLRDPFLCCHVSEDRSTSPRLRTPVYVASTLNDRLRRRVSGHRSMSHVSKHRDIPIRVECRFLATWPGCNIRLIDTSFSLCVI